LSSATDAAILAAVLSPIETALIVILLAVLMFGMGAGLTLAHFRDVLAFPRAFVIGTLSQFVVVPLLALGLASALQLGPIDALALLLMGTCPGGATSNLYALLSRADTALSVSMTAASKAIGVVMMPLTIFLLGRGLAGDEVRIPYADLVTTLVFLLAPVGLGMVLRKRRGEAAAARAERFGSIAGIVVIAVLVTVSVTRNRALFAEVAPREYAAALLLGTAGLAFGYLAATLAGLPAAKRRTVAFETGVQNAPLCFAIIALSFDGDVEARMLRVPLLYALFAIVQGGALTLLFRRMDSLRTGRTSDT
jgi:BASS family bile acid:Na+ symporter